MTSIVYIWYQEDNEWDTSVMDTRYPLNRSTIVRMPNQTVLAFSEANYPADERSEFLLVIVCQLRDVDPDATRTHH